MRGLWRWVLARYRLEGWRDPAEPEPVLPERDWVLEKTLYWHRSYTR